SLQGKISSDGCLKKEQMVVSAIASTPQLVDRGKRSAIIFCRMRVLHKTCYVPLSTGQVTAHPPTRKQH
ncbi:hypothetical protein, partial [Escherichia coli]|uniref:hypothetical protein n=1 Tax=Escherichia coli TaxID=562 RepID=UPI001BC8BBB3